MSHCNFDVALSFNTSRATIIKATDVFARNDLSQTSIFDITDFNKVVIKQNKIGTEKCCRARFANKLEYDGSRDFAVFVDINSWS